MKWVYKNLCPTTTSASIMAANMRKNSLKNVESDKNNILCKTLLDFLRRNGAYFLNKPHIYIYIYIYMCYLRSLKFTLKHIKRSYMFR